MNAPLSPRPEILAIDAYVPGKSAVAGVTKIHKLSSNESPLGASPRAIEAFKAAADKLALYPDGGASELREAIGRAYGLDPDRIVCGNGSDEILGMLAFMYLRPGEEGLYSQYGFLEYPIAIRAAGGVPVVAAEKNFTTDVDAMLRLVSEKTRIVYLANPNNPTGTYVSASQVRRLHAGLPESALLVLDSAYAEYVSRNDYEAGVELASTTPNVVMTRTFSKIHGLAGLRLGWAYGPPEVIGAYNRVRDPFNVNGPALAAGAAAIGDADHVARAAAHNALWLPKMRDEIAALGIEIPSSVGNFLLLRFPAKPGRDATSADAFLSQHGFVLRAVGAYGLSDCLRLTIGSEEANLGLLSVLKAFMSGRHDG